MFTYFIYNLTHFLKLLFAFVNLSFVLLSSRFSLVRRNNTYHRFLSDTEPFITLLILSGNTDLATGRNELKPRVHLVIKEWSRDKAPFNMAARGLSYRILFLSSHASHSTSRSFLSSMENHFLPASLLPIHSKYVYCTFDHSCLKYPSRNNLHLVSFVLEYLLRTFK